MKKWPGDILERLEKNPKIGPWVAARRGPIMVIVEEELHEAEKLPYWYSRPSDFVVDPQYRVTEAELGDWPPPPYRGKYYGQDAWSTALWAYRDLPAWKQLEAEARKYNAYEDKRFEASDYPAVPSDIVAEILETMRKYSSHAGVIDEGRRDRKYRSIYTLARAREHLRQRMGQLRAYIADFEVIQAQLDSWSDQEILDQLRDYAARAGGNYHYGYLARAALSHRGYRWGGRRGWVPDYQKPLPSWSDIWEEKATLDDYNRIKAENERASEQDSLESHKRTLGSFKRARLYLDRFYGPKSLAPTKSNLTRELRKQGGLEKYQSVEVTFRDGEIFFRPCKDCYAASRGSRYTKDDKRRIKDLDQGLLWALEFIDRMSRHDPEKMTESNQFFEIHRKTSDAAWKAVTEPDPGGFQIPTVEDLTPDVKHKSPTPGLDAQLDSIQILFRDNTGSLGLWGIPHRLREDIQQAPRDLWDRRSELGWIWLGSPGWWGKYPKADQAKIAAYLETWADMVPASPGEWGKPPEGPAQQRIQKVLRLLDINEITRWDIDQDHIAQTLYSHARGIREDPGYGGWPEEKRKAVLVAAGLIRRYTALQPPKSRTDNPRAVVEADACANVEALLARCREGIHAGNIIAWGWEHPQQEPIAAEELTEGAGYRALNLGWLGEGARDADVKRARWYKASHSSGFIPSKATAWVLADEGKGPTWFKVAR